MISPPRCLRLVPAFCLALAGTVAFQWTGNAYRAEWSDQPDEPVHYITGLLVRDYIAQGLPGPPMGFAQAYHEHYPRVGLGHWPPVFYVVQAVWTLPFTPSRTSLLLLMATINAWLLTLTYAVIIRYFPRWLAWGFLVLLVTLPAVRQYSRALMAESLVALLTLASLAALARYLESQRWQAAAWFGVLASATILTKGTGLALAPLPLLAVLLLRRWRALRTWSFWIPAVIVVAACGPWFALAPGALHERVATYGGVNWQGYRWADSLRYWLAELGLAGVCLAALGMARTIGRLCRKKDTDPFWVLCLLLVATTAVMRTVIGVWENRHLLTTLPVLILFMCSGLAWLVEAGFGRRPLGGVLALVLLGLASANNVGRVQPKKHLGLDAVALDLAVKPQYAAAPLLIVSDVAGEGAFIAEVARQERRPGHVIERGWKVLASATFMGGAYRLRFATPAELLRFFEQEPERIVVLDVPERVFRHVDLVRETVARYPDRWELLATYPRSGLRPGSSAENRILVLRLRH